MGTLVAMVTMFGFVITVTLVIIDISVNLSAIMFALVTIFTLVAFIVVTMATMVAFVTIVTLVDMPYGMQPPQLGRNPPWVR